MKRVLDSPNRVATAGRDTPAVIIEAARRVTLKEINDRANGSVRLLNALLARSELASKPAGLGGRDARIK
jgi:hypothetical protein